MAEITLNQIFQNIQSKAIKKDQRNDFGKYNFYNINQLKALVNSEFKDTNFNHVIQKKYEIVGSDVYDFMRIVVFNEKFEEIMESGWTHVPKDTLKGMNKFQITGSGESYIGKYLYTSFFGLSTDAVDPDEEVQEKKVTPRKVTKEAIVTDDYLDKELGDNLDKIEW